MYSDYTNNNEFQQKLAEKAKQRDKLVNAKTKQLEIEAEKKRRDEEKIEIMTQFMLDPTSSATKLLEKRREMYELQEALQNDKQKFADKEIQFKKLEDDLRQKDEDFHIKIVEYYKNSYEKKHGESDTQNFKILQEKSRQNELCDQINQLKEDNRKLESNLRKMKEILDSLREYEDFLKKVKDKQPDNYTEIEDIISKYRVLEENLKYLEEKEELTNAEINNERISFKNKKAEYENRINKIIGEINIIQQKLKDQKEEKKSLENDVTQYEKNSNNLASSLEQILLAINNIYKKCENKKEWTKHELGTNDNIDYTDLPSRVNKVKLMLKCINSYIEDYKEIEESYYKEIKETKKK